VHANPDESLDAAYFESLYARSPDPWDFAQSEYERAKYRATVAALDGLSFGRALEVGCSVGVLTEMLAPRVTSLLAVDVNERALVTARERCAVLPNVEFARANLPHEFPSGAFDLIVVSEVGYYWSPRDLATAIDLIARAAAGGFVELVHYLPKVEAYPSSGDAVHAAFLADERFSRQRAARAERYRLDLLAVAP
jgi:SAM-dependent methyltransferase